MIIQANAKINRTLWVIKRRSDGYHDIDSIIQSIDLSDYITIEKSKTDTLTGAIIADCDSQLILKAKKILEEKVSRNLPCAIHLQKAIPIAAGLGGGSTDAAAILVGLNALYDLSLSQASLANIASEVGTDVPFFIYGGNCRVQGIGDKVSRANDAPSSYYVLAKTCEKKSTKYMYELIDKDEHSFLEMWMELDPMIKNLATYFESFAPKEWGLSGSGPTMFCGVNSYHLAEKIAYGLRSITNEIYIVRPCYKGIKIISD